MFGLDISRRFIAISIFLLVFVAPAGAYVLASTSHSQSKDAATLNPPQRTDAQLQAALDSYVNEQQDATSIPKSTIVSSKRMEKSWYVVTVKQSDDDTDLKLKALIGDFYKGANRLQVIVAPNDSLQGSNISNSMGVPYDVIDELYN